MSKHSIKFLARKPPKIFLNVLIILSGISLDFQTFLESNHLIVIDICSLSTFLKMEQAKFTYSPFGEAFEKQIKTIEDQGKNQIDALNTLKSNN